MIASLDASALDRRDRAALGQHGWYWPSRPAIGTRPTKPRAEFVHDVPMAADYARLAQRTFPDACPPDMRQEDIAAHVGDHLSQAAFESHIEAPDRVLVGIRDGGELIAYSLSVLPDGDGAAGADRGAPLDAVLPHGERIGPLIEMSKFYLDREWRGTGLAGMLMNATLHELAARTRAWERPYVWLGTNPRNRRAQALYAKLGFTVTGRRSFMVGEQNNDDIVMARTLDVTY